MKKSIFFASFIASCMWFNESLAQVIVTRRPVVYRPHRVVVVKPAPVIAPARRVVVVKPAPVVIPAPARIVRVAPIRPHRRVVVYR